MRFVLAVTAFFAVLGLTGALTRHYSSPFSTYSSALSIAIFGCLYVACLCCVVGGMFLFPARISVLAGLCLSLLTLWSSFLQHQGPADTEFLFSTVSSSVLLALSLWGYVRLTSLRK